MTVTVTTTADEADTCRLMRRTGVTPSGGSPPAEAAPSSALHGLLGGAKPPDPGRPVVSKPAANTDVNFANLDEAPCPWPASGAGT